jgi:hypothetical protein
MQSKTIHSRPFSNLCIIATGLGCGSNSTNTTIQQMTFDDKLGRRDSRKKMYNIISEQPIVEVSGFVN